MRGITFFLTVEEGAAEEFLRVDFQMDLKKLNKKKVKESLKLSFTFFLLSFFSSISKSKIHDPNNSFFERQKEGNTSSSESISKWI